MLSRRHEPHLDHQALEEAADWLIRMSEGELSDSERGEWEYWKASTPERGHAWARAQLAGTDTRSLQDYSFAVAAARANGFKSVSMDLIYGLPRQNLEGFARTLDTVIAVQRSTTGDRLIELDSPNVADRTPSNAIPQTRFQVNNFTFVMRDGAPQVVQARGGAAIGLTNGVINAGTNHCFQIDEPTTLAAIIGVDSVVGDCPATDPIRGGGGNTNADVAARINQGTNNNFAFAITLTNNVVNGAGETGRTAFNANTRSTFFPTRTFVGAIQNGAALTTIFGNWTCNSSIQNFNSSTGNCTGLPVYPA